jgi:anti-sigma B factor antagonist
LGYACRVLSEGNDRELVGVLEFGVNVRDAAAGPIVGVVGDLDLASAPALRKTLTDLFAESPATVVVDLGAITFIDSTGLAVLVGAARRAQTMGSRIVFRNPRASIRKVIELTGADRVLTLS